MKKYSIYGSEYFTIENSYHQTEIVKLSKKYSKSNWRKDSDQRVLKPEDVKHFHGPLKYIYFSEVKKDSLRADILENPFAKYSMTKGEHYLIVFENNAIKSVQKTTGYYD
ncbi:hypothetical protein K0U91_11370 [Chryseobacterium chendengshani]|uniref:hypothetical protein n=1 Tax=Chryseobacterium sp. LJ668 TaxID=2864040 RepID=UPI001C69091E|nr:hypothetical protein [Chryseobacterium sp. LJ668]MBW8523371.1 hypothetical protein [Chryseobacterium sp. LJ668]QYK15660.1 hypothetical protein K0U91_11370 [Chryseobacterium sp. LJ668]